MQAILSFVQLAHYVETTGRPMLVKQYSYGAVICAMPDMRLVKKGEVQQLKKTGFCTRRSRDENSKILEFTPQKANAH